MYIGILEDDPTLLEMYQLWFSTSGYRCHCSSTTKEFTQALGKENFDLLLVDWMLPDGTGDQVVKWVREHMGWEIPVLFVTSKDSEVDIVTGLRAGADDYVIKPPKYLELVARLEALTRRLRTAPQTRFGVYEIDPERRNISVEGQTIDLTQKEYELATYMFQHPGKLLSRVHLLEKLWGINAEIDTRTVDTHVSRIRRKLAIGPERGWQIIPVYGWGYRIENVSAEGVSAA
jgi:two-component system response regulator RegX3